MTAAPGNGPAVTQLAPSGTLRAAINFGNPILATKDPATGEARGVSFEEIARQTTDNFFRLFRKVPRAAQAAA